MKATITRKYSFEAAHYLPKTHVNHKCHRMHGHNFRVTIEVAGDVDAEMGWVIDFKKIDDLFSGAVHRVVDHRLLNEISGLENPTSEHIARWVWERMWKHAAEMRMSGEWPDGCAIGSVTVWEIDGFAVTYTGTQ